MDQWTSRAHESHYKTSYGRHYHYESLEQLKIHLGSFIKAYNYGKPLKALKGLTPFEKIVEFWDEQPESFYFNPYHLNMGPYSYTPQKNIFKK